MDYGKILRRSWEIIWNHKFMMVLGFLAALGSGSFNFSGGGGGNSGSSFDGSQFGAIPQMTDNLAAVLATAGVIIIGLICFFFIVGIVLWLLSLTAQAGLIDGASRLDAGQKVTFGEAFSAGWHKLGRMVGINLVLFGIFIIFAIIGVVVLAGAAGASFAGAASSADDFSAVLATLGAGFIALFCCLFCVLFIYGIVAGIIYPFAQRAAVLEDMGVMDSIRRGWQVIRQNLGEVIVLLLIFLVIGLLVGVVTFAVFIPVAAISFAPIGLRLFGGETIQFLDVVLATGGFLCLILLGAVISSVYEAFRSTAFTLAYQEFVNKNLSA